MDTPADTEKFRVRETPQKSHGTAVAFLSCGANRSVVQGIAAGYAADFSDTSTSSSIFFASPNSMRLFSL